MKTVRMSLLTRVFAFAFLVASTVAVAAGELPGDSIYQLPVTLTDQQGRDFAFAKRAGRPQLVSMFYISCQYVCPLIIETMKKTQHALDARERARLDVLLVSFDPARDTTERLKEVFGERKLDARSWTLARTDEASVRKLAAVLGVQYRALANREINHSTSIVLLDEQGRIVARTDRLGEVDPGFVTALHAALSAR
jgi:protein SCO1/2